MDQFSKWLRPPDFEDAFLDLQAKSLFNSQIIALIAFIGIGLVGSVFRTSETLISIAIAIPTLLVSIFLTRKGKLEAAVILIVLMTCGVVSYTLLFSGEGIHTVSILFFPTAIILSARVLPWRSMVIVTLTMILSLAIVTIIEWRGLIVTLYTLHKPTAIVEDFLIITVAIFTSAISMRLVIERMNQSLEKAQKAERELVEKNRQLNREVADRRRAEMEILSLNARLEERVNARTAELQQALMELESFSYTISHDLRAPLRAVDGLASIVLQESAGKLDAQTVEYLNRIKNNGKHMGVLIDGLLEFLRIGRLELQKRDISPSLVAHDAIAKLLPEYKGRQIAFDVVDLPSCKADAELLKQVYEKLLHNAIKFTREQKEARIQVGFFKQSKPTIYFVRDNGVGFDMKHIDKLFGVFQKLHHPEEFEGTGLSLALVQRIIHQHGGKIWAEAEVNKGATFYFTLQ